MLLVGAGVLLVRGLRPSAGRGVALGLVIACVIATYTLVDKRGVAHAAPLPYLEISMHRAGASRTRRSSLSRKGRRRIA